MSFQIINSELTMTSREIADLVEARHNDVIATIERLFGKGLLRSSRKTRQEATGGRPVEVYDLIERDCYLVVAGYSDEMRARLIDRWQELEANAAKPNIKELSRLEILQIAMDSEKARIEAENKLALAAPKVQFVDKYVERESLQNATQVSETFKMSAVTMNKHLDKIGGVYNKSIKRSRVFCGEWVSKGYGEIKQTEQGYTQSLFTPKGVIRVHELLISEGIV